MEVFVRGMHIIGIGCRKHGFLKLASLKRSQLKTLPCTMASCAQPRYMPDCEKRLDRQWVYENGQSVEKVARRLRQNRSSIWEFLADEFHERLGLGRRGCVGRTGQGPLGWFRGKDGNRSRCSLSCYRTNDAEKVPPQISHANSQ